MLLFRWTFELFGHFFAIGMKLDITTLTNLALIVTNFFLLRYLTGSKITASWCIVFGWLAMEAEAAFRFHWEGCCPGNMGDLGELAMAVIVALILRRFSK